MLQTFKNAWKVQELRKKILFTLMIILLYRIGAVLFVPFVDVSQVDSISSHYSGNIFQFVSLLSGEAFGKGTFFALSVSPYITASIVMQLLTIAIPALEEMQRDGDDGRKKIAAITRYLTVALAVIESGAMAISYKGILMEPFRNALGIITVIAAMTAGSAFLMWLGERITENGVGNGISIVLVINIISTFPQDAMAIYNRVVWEEGKMSSVPSIILKSAIAIIVVVLMIIAVIVLNDAVRKIPIQYAITYPDRLPSTGRCAGLPDRTYWA